MPKPLRLFASDTYYFVTQRCSEERHFLEPSSELNHIVGGWIARAQHRYGVEIFAYCLMSNHWHFVLRAPDNNLASFMAYLSGNVARAVNRIHGHHGDVWEDRYAAQPILDQESLSERIEYTEMNPVKAKLCAEPDEWCGLTSARHETHDLSFDMVHRREWQRSSGMSQARIEQHTKRYVLRIQRVREGTRGRVRAFLRCDPYSRPDSPKRRRAPQSFGSDSSRRVYRDTYRAFRSSHRVASQAFRSGKWGTEFPTGSFRPPLVVAV